MRISNNTKLINRNKRISQIVLYLSLALLVVGLLWSLTSPTVTQTQFSYLVLIPAYILVQVSIFLANRWSRSPRPDEIVAQSLKGLPDQYSLYNYYAGVNHLLVGPAGLWIIKPYYHSGEIAYDSEKNRFRQKGGPFIISKLFGQESLPDISHESKIAKGQFEKFIKKNDLKIDIDPKIVNIFYSEKADLNTRNAPEPTMPADKLKDFIRGQAKQNSYRNEEIEKITNQLPDPEV
jgi:flagellar biosynthesis protein FliQ